MRSLHGRYIIVYKEHVNVMSGSNATAELPAHDAHKVIDWVKLMRLERISEDTFRSTCRAFNPSGDGSPAGRPKQAYGGHVYAQAVLAASKHCRQLAQAPQQAKGMTRSGRSQSGQSKAIHSYAIA